MRMYLLGGLLLLVLDLLLQGLLLALGDERLLGSTLALVVLGTLTTWCRAYRAIILRNKAAAASQRCASENAGVIAPRTRRIEEHEDNSLGVDPNKDNIESNISNKQR